MSTDNQATRRSLVAGGTLAAALALANHPKPAKAKKKGKKPKPPIASAMIRVTSAYYAYAGPSSTWTITYEATVVDRRPNPHQGSSTSLTLTFATDKLASFSKLARRQICSDILNTSSENADRVPVLIR